MGMKFTAENVIGENTMNKTRDFPFKCVGGCGRFLRPMKTSQEDYPDTNGQHAGKGLCVACYAAQYRKKLEVQNRSQDAQNGPSEVPEGDLPYPGRRTTEDYYFKPVKPGAWVLEGNCTSEGDKFFERSVVEAKKLCKNCPIRRRCAEMGIENDEAFGVWGGLSRQDRKKVINGTITLDEALNEKPRAQAGLESHEEHDDRLVGVS